MCLLVIVTWCLAGDRTNVNDVGIQDRAAVNEQLDAWTAHKTETGVVYYYNALTGESTYEKPAEFKGEVFTIRNCFLLILNQLDTCRRFDLAT